jgi:hypothetical protein
VERGIQSPRQAWSGLWEPARLGWWIAVLFMLGAACFAGASFVALDPGPFGRWVRNVAVINGVFFVGSIFFTSAAYAQLFEAANADRLAARCHGEAAGEGIRWFGWKPDEIGWLSTFIQFLGTLLFNVATLDALRPGPGWFGQDLLVWTPDSLGSVCFLAASWLAVLEYCHGFWSWQLGSLSWWIVMVNLTGSVFFMISALFSVVLPGSGAPAHLVIVNLATCAGAICFLMGAILLLPEMATQVPRTEPGAGRDLVPGGC